MSIAIIAYGSLIWDEECLAPHIHGGWQRGAGPRLPVEFSRISPKRKGALVLVVDPAARAVPTSVTASRRSRLIEAAKDLARRERAPEEAIGIAEKGGRAFNCDEATGRRVLSWLERQETFHAAVWTHLPANFEAETGRPFTFEAGVAWLRGLKGDALFEAWRYIHQAPEETDTAFRRHLAEHPFWQTLCARFGKAGQDLRACVHHCQKIQEA